MKYIYIAALLLPVFTAGLLLTKLGGKRWRLISCAALGLEVILCALAALLPKQPLTVFTLLDLPFVIFPDAVGCIFACLFSLLFLTAGIFSTEYLEHDRNPGAFGAAYILTLDALLGLSWAGDLQTCYMFFECLTLSSFPLILHDLREKSRAAALKYLCYSLMGAGLILFGLVYGKSILGTLSFSAGGGAVPAGLEKKALAAAFITVVGFGCKAGIMPLHDWLPTAHPQAPAPASAILSGCVTKAGVMGALRTVYYVFGASFLRGTWVQTALIVMALLTVFCGSMLAYKERALKKRLAYSTVSQVSYALFGLFLMSQAGFVGAMLQVVFHAVTKVCLFMCAGAMIHHSGREYVYSSDGRFQYSGMGKSLPLIMLGFTLASLSLVGLPPFGGFVSKWYLAEGSFAALGFSGWTGAAVLLLSALLTAGYLLSISAGALFPGPEDETVPCGTATWRMTVPVMVLALALAILGIYCFGLTDALSSLAARLV